jgi:pilus assembly protein Flp/PilA
MDERPLTATPQNLLTLASYCCGSGRGPEEGGVDAIRRNLRRLLAGERGATAIEYALIAALIAVVMISGVSALGGGAGAMWSDLSTTVSTYM